MTTTEVDPVEAAEKEAAEAAALAVSLEQQIRQGDDSITAEQLVEAENLGRFARLRVEAAQRKASQAKAKAAGERAQAVYENLHGLADEDAEFTEAWADAVQSMRRFNEVLVHRNNVVAGLVDEIANADALLRRDAASDISAFGVKPAMFGGDIGFRVPAEGIDVAQVEASRALATVAHEALDGGLLRSLVAVAGSREPDLANTTLAGRVTGWADTIRATQEDA